MRFRPADRTFRTVIETWRALLGPRRLVPIVAVSLPLIAAQVVFGGGAADAVLATALVLLFMLVGPAAWRLLFPGSGAPPPWPSWVRLFAFIGVGVLCVLLVGVVTARSLGLHTFLTAHVSLLICAAFFVVGGWGLGRDVDFEENLKRERARVALLEKEAESARLLALKSHLDPHFLFNTLNAIAEWCREDGEVAERAVLQLAEILRTILSGVRTPTWPLAKERQLLLNLAALHRLRDPGLFELALHVEPGLDDLLVPPLLVLPLLENAVKHGPAAGHRGRLDLTLSRTPEALSILVENPGPYRGPRPGGEGLRVVASRLALFTDSQGTLTIEEVEGARDRGPRTRATLRIPLGGTR